MEIIKLEVKNEELENVVNVTGLEPTESEQIKQSYLPFFVEIEEIKKEAKKIDFENPTLLDEKIAKDLRLRMMRVRTGSEKVKEDRKKVHALKANVEQAAWNLIKTGCLLEENNFEQVEKKREIAEKLRKENLKNFRTEQLQSYLEFVPIVHLNLGEMSDEDFEKLLSGAKLQLEAKIEAEKKAEQERIEKERIENLHNQRKNSVLNLWNYATDFEKTLNFGEQSESDWNNFRDRLNALHREQLEKEKAQRLEVERLKKEAEEKEKALDLERKKQAEILTKLKAEADKKQKEIEEKARIEREKQEAEAKRIKAENDAKLEAQRIENARIQKELDDKKAKEEQERKEKEAAELHAKKEAEKLAKAPIKKQAKLWVESFSIANPPIENPTINVINAKFEAFKKWSLEQIENL